MTGAGSDTPGTEAPGTQTSGTDGPGVDLRVSLGDLVLANPVMVASGCVSGDGATESLLDLTAPGALVTRSVTLDERAGGPPPRAVETAAGLLVDTGLQGPGLQGFLATELPRLVQRGARVVVSIAGDNLGEYAELARRLGSAPGVAGVEVNLGWPGDGQAARDSYQATKIVAAVRRDMPRGLPVLAKLAADVHHVVDVARAAVKAGADAVVVGHGVPGMVIDPVTLRPALGSAKGMLAGPATHAVAVRCVWQLHAAVPQVSVIGCGGVRSTADALAMLAAGASAVQVGSSVLHDPSVPQRLVTGIAEELNRRRLPDVASLVGIAHRDQGDHR